MKKIHTFITAGCFLLCFVFLLAFVKGPKGDPLYFQKNADTAIGSPFELSNSTARYVLTDAIVKNHTFFLTQSEAQLGIPDVVDYKGKFFSIFTPGVSFLGVPFYIIGNYFGMPQYGTYFTIALFAFVNALLIFKLSRSFGVNIYASVLSGFAFLFATNALPYSQSFTQHHITVTLILLSLLNIRKERTWFTNILLGMYFGFSLLVDIPNAFLLMPVLGYAFFKHFSVKEHLHSLKVHIKTSIIALCIGIIPLLGAFAYYNYQTTGSYTKIAQLIGRTHFFRKQTAIQNPADSPTEKKDTALKGVQIVGLPFETRNMLNGFYILIFSNERSIFYYSPVLILGLIGLLLAFKKNNETDLLKIIFSIAIINVVLYSMFDDPWGGWSFGPRYLIPSTALLSIGIGPFLQFLKKKYIAAILFVVLLLGSIYINVLGTITTSAIPPKVEAEALKPALPYTYDYNFSFIDKNESSNLLYNQVFTDVMNERTYLLLLTAVLSVLAIAITIASSTQKEKTS
jgi:hypothetical protein